MKKIALIAAFGLSLFAGFSSEARVSVNVSVGTPVFQQPWYGVDNDYIYMPQQGVYFNPRRQVYIYQDGGRWCSAAHLPARYGRVNYRNVHTVRMRDFRPFGHGYQNVRQYPEASNGRYRNDRQREVDYNRNGGYRGQNDGRYGRERG